MNIVYFTHSLASCWNHGNAHFIRGVLRDLIARGHHVTAYEPAGGWSRQNLLRHHGPCGLAFGEALAAVYRRWGWGRRVFVWHEAADATLFHPPAEEGRRQGLVWIGNWGDGERTSELEAFLLAPAADAGLPLEVYGVRYP